MPYPVYLILWFTVTIPAIVGMVFYRRLLKSTRLIVILMCLGFLVELGLRLTAHSGLNNIYIINYYTFFEILLLTLFFAKTLSSASAIKIVKIGGAIVMASVITEMILSDANLWVSFSSSLESIFIIAAGLFYFYEVATAISPDSPSKSANFWLVAIILLYFMSSLEYFLLNRYLVNVSARDLVMLGDIHTFVNAFCNLAYSLILWKFTRPYSLAQS